MYTSALNFVCGLIVPGFASTIPRSTSSFSTPRSSTPMLSPASPPSSTFPNISIPAPPVLFPSPRNPPPPPPSPPSPPPPPPPPLPPPPPPPQHPDVVPRQRLVQHLPEHLDPRRHRLLPLRPQPHQLHFLPQLQPPPLHPPRRHRPPPRDREDVLHAHQKRLVHFPHRRRNVTVHRVHQRPDARRPLVLPPPHLRLLPPPPPPPHRPPPDPPDRLPPH